MLTFTNTPVTKDMLIASLERHAIADAFIKGTYGIERNDGKGCAVGCSLREFTKEQSSHSEYERLFGIPKIIARLEDGIFEGLPLAESKLWPLQFANAIPTGRDLSMVWPKFAHWLLIDGEFGVINFAKSEIARQSILRISALYSRWIDGNKPSKNQWAVAVADAEAEADVYSAAAAAARAGHAAARAGHADADVYSAAAAAARAGGEAARAGHADADADADAAAYAAASAAAALTNRENHRIAQSKYLIRLLSEA